MVILLSAWLLLAQTTHYCGHAICSEEQYEREQAYERSERSSRERERDQPRVNELPRFPRTQCITRWQVWLGQWETVCD